MSLEFGRAFESRLRSRVVIAANSWPGGKDATRID
jgi:hypothetical protein